MNNDIMNGSTYSYSHPLIPPYSTLNYPGTDCYMLYNSKEYVLKSDSDFAQACQFATVQVVLNYQYTHFFAILEKALVTSNCVVSRTTLSRNFDCSNYSYTQDFPQYRTCSLVSELRLCLCL